MKDIATRIRLGESFHRTFPLRRNQIQDILQVAYEAESQGESGNWNREKLRETSSIGTRQAESSPRYAYGMGLLDNKNKLTEFGRLAYENDPMLDKPETLWLMHYYLSAPNGFGPSYWYTTVSTHFRVSDIISKENLAEQIADHIRYTENRELTSRSAQSSANIFLKAYSESDGLSSLGILREIDHEKLYLIEEPLPPPLWAFAVAFLDFCQYQFPNQVTINLESLYADGGLTSIFMIGEGRINRYLRQLQDEGVVEIYRVAPPYQVVLINPNPSVAFASLYKTDDYDD